MDARHTIDILDVCLLRTIDIGLDLWTLSGRGSPLLLAVLVDEYLLNCRSHSILKSIGGLFRRHVGSVDAIVEVRVVTLFYVQYPGYLAGYTATTRAAARVHRQGGRFHSSSRGCESSRSRESVSEALPESRERVKLEACSDPVGHELLS